MSEKRIRNYEVKCLLELLSAIINGEEIPRWNRQPQWGDVYKIADYHGVANIVYYALLALDDEKLAPWKFKFGERFHQAVLAQERYSTVIPALVAVLEKQKIHCLVLSEYRLCKYYPQSDMGNLKSAGILVEKGKEGKLKETMDFLDFEVKEGRAPGEIPYYRIPGVQAVIHTSFCFTNKKMQKYFALPIKSYEKERNCRYVHTFLPEELYVYVIGQAAENYARGNISIREILDIWVYYGRVYQELNWEDITKEISILKLEQFHTYLIQLAGYWFGGMLLAADDSVFEAMEMYILSKGALGREISATLLPLVKEVADFEEKDLRKRRREQIKTWIFPQKDYMETIFPILKKARWLLPACYLLRLLRFAKQHIWLFFKKKYALCKVGICKAAAAAKRRLESCKAAVAGWIKEKAHSWMQILKRILNIHK